MLITMTGFMFTETELLPKLGNADLVTQFQFAVMEFTELGERASVPPDPTMPRGQRTDVVAAVVAAMEAAKSRVLAIRDVLVARLDGLTNEAQPTTA